MKNFLILFFLFIGTQFICKAQTNYDPALAKQLGADDYGMKKYVIAFLYRGDHSGDYSDEEKAKFQAGHLANINRLASEGLLVLAGPFFGNEELRGLFFFNVESLEEVEKLTAPDPSIQAGILRIELKEWYASAALPLLLEWHPKVAKEKF
jgi:uncharacterized protein